jgi:hypothetical protein
LKVRPKKISLKLGNCPMLAARYCGPFEILYRIGNVAYELSFLASIKDYNVFNVSLFKKYVLDPNHDIEWDLIQVEPKGDT